MWSPLRCVRSLFQAGLIIALAVVASSTEAEAESTLERFLAEVPAVELFDGAEEYGSVEPDTQIAPILRHGRIEGYAFLNSDFANASGYSGKPIHILIGLDTNGVITGLRLVAHKEPIVLVGIPESRIAGIIAGYVGFDTAAFASTIDAEHDLDIITGATVTIMVIDDSIIRSAIKVARELRLGGLAPLEASGPQWRVDLTIDETVDWRTLLDGGSVHRLHLSLADINAAFDASGDAEAAARPEEGGADEDFIDLYAAVVSVPSIGRSLLGDAEYANLLRQLEPGDEAILLAGNGRYSFKGSGYVRGGVFDRFQIIQGDESYRFRDRYHKRLGEVAAEGAPVFREVDLFIIPAGDFDAARGWRLELLVAREVAATQRSFLTFELDYAVPEHYLLELAVAESDFGFFEQIVSENGDALWVRLWRDKAVEVVILSVALAALTVLFFAQDWLTRHPVRTERIRIAFLLFTLFGIGFYAKAQLSVVNVMTFVNALIGEFSWDSFLIEPLIFVLWFSVAASLLFWGRGPYCGWLCPFGALQELLNKAAKLARVPQIRVPWWLHERLWPLKYMIFLCLFGLSLHSLGLAEQAAEIEPFKTAIILNFDREWPFVIYVGLLLFAGLFIERFFCRYLCPLGGALGIPGRMRMFDWLKRYRECGHPCQRCSNECMVAAIHPEGHINPNECLSCLHCQTLYNDDQRCPVVIQKRLKRERREALASPATSSTKSKKRKGTHTILDTIGASKNAGPNLSDERSTER